MIPTGPGRVTTSARAHSSTYSDWIYLENFDIDGVTVKSEHRHELSRRFGATHSIGGDLMMADDNKWIFLRGYASRTGGAEHNIDLSMQRVFAVQDYLLSMGISNDHITGLDYVGEEWSHAEIEEDDQFRCVEVIGRHENIPPPPSVPVFIRDRFRMRAMPVAASELGLLGEALGLAGGLGATILKIEIQNLATREIRTYAYGSIQVTAGLSLPTPGAPPSAPDTDPSREFGAWVDFNTRSNHHVSFYDLEGEASFGSMLGVQIGPYSAGDSYFQFNSDRIHNVERWATVNPRTIVLPMPDSSGLSFSLASMSAFGRLILWR